MVEEYNIIFVLESNRLVKGYTEYIRMDYLEVLILPVFRVKDFRVFMHCIKTKVVPRLCVLGRI